MHICHINLSREFSGGEIQTLNLLEGLSKNSVQQSIVLRHDSQMIKKIKKLGISYIPASFFWSKHKHVDNSSIDVFHAHDAKAVHWAYWHTRFTKHPYIFTRRIDNRPHNRFFTRRAYKQASRIVCLSKAIKKVVEEFESGVMTTKIPDCYSSFSGDLKLQMQIKKRYPNKFLVGQVSKLIPHKGHHLTIEAAKIIKKTHPHIHFLIIGEGYLQRSLEQEVKVVRDQAPPEVSSVPRYIG